MNVLDEKVKEKLIAIKHPQLVREEFFELKPINTFTGILLMLQNRNMN